MLVKLVWWEMSDSRTPLEGIREYLRDESVDAFSTVPGLRLKLWISQPEKNRFGAVYLWNSREESQVDLPSRAVELIGKGPDLVEEFELEASIEAETGPLSRLGLAFGS